MNLSYRNTCLIDTRRPAGGIRDLKNAGIENLMLCIAAWLRPPEEDNDETASRRWKMKTVSKREEPETIKKRYLDMIAACRKDGIDIPVLYAPRFGRRKGKPWPQNYITDVMHESIDFCKKAECRYLVIGMPEEEKDDTGFYGKLSEKARKADIHILLVNQTTDLSGHLVRGVLCEPKRAVEVIDRLNRDAGQDVFGFCLDMGVCNICGNDVQGFVNALGNRLKAVILRDNDGHKNASLLPFTCAYGEKTVTDWMGLIRGLREIGFDGELIVDFTDTLAAFSPLIRPTLFKLAREVGDYFKWQIEIENNLKKYKRFVLFGAGNMCRNYMKCYGEKYPPLFTCDNNPKLWGTEFEGLIVKNPEELKNLPEDCCVVICNIYYREIERQLQEMGIKNIGYFNDEYMPSFYFDRLDRGNE
ncbi:MAG: hypothetical protein NC392_05890 [Roseburia sp.]|nr:hypothetical protein [Roseburia sp.]MCM1201631.1 hypothetical protein [Bacteroides fragilis]